MDKVEYTESRLENVDNSYQNYHVYRRTLCVCSAGLLRSPTLAWVLSNPPYNRNTRAAGSHPEYALVQVDSALLTWAAEIVFVNEENRNETYRLHPHFPVMSAVYILDLPDQYGYRAPELLAAIYAELKRVGFPKLTR